VTSAGRAALLRRARRCGGCGLTAYPTDARLRLDGFLSPGGAIRLACLAAASWSFDSAAARLEEAAGVRLDGEAAGRREATPPAVAFATAEGEAELLTHRVIAPTRDG
jgi:hypothetical protein